MKKYFLSLIVIAFNFSCFSLQIFDQNEDKFESFLFEEQFFNKKFYIDLSSVCITSDGLFLNLEDLPISIFNINSDENGYYTYVTGWTPCFNDDWRCVNGHWSPSYENRCVTCGKAKQANAPRWKDHRK